MKAILLRGLVLGVAVAALSACSTVNSRITHHQAQFAAATPDQQDLIRKGRIALGFTKEMVEMALGRPDRISVTTDEKGQRESWSYYEANHASSYYFTDPFFWGPPSAYRYRHYRPIYLPATQSSLSRTMLVRFSKDGLVVMFEGEVR